MIGLITCLVLFVTVAVCAEAVRAGCRRRLMTPVAVRRTRPAEDTRVG